MRSIASTTVTSAETKQALAAVQFMILAIKASHKYGFNLDEPDAALMIGVATLVFVEGAGKKAGAAFVMHDGEIKCLCGTGGVFDELVQLCIAAGGDYLTVYDGALVDRYKAHGFEEYKREPFDETLGANVPRWAGTPDVVYLRRNG